MALEFYPACCFTSMLADHGFVLFVCRQQNSLERSPCVGQVSNRFAMPNFKLSTMRALLMHGDER